MTPNTLKIPLERDKKIILISDLRYCLSSNKEIYFRDDLKWISKKDLTQLIKTISQIYSNFVFWWLDSHEAVITHWDREEIGTLLEVFKDLGIGDKLFFLDNNLGKSKYDKILNRISGPFLLGLTSERGFEIKPRTFDKKFICLNRLPKPHRRVTFRFLKENYLKDSYLSFAPGYPKDEDRMVFDEVEGISYGNLLSAWPVEEQKRSFCNIVTETLLYPANVIHITEKTDKCFSSGQPFVMVGGPYYLKKLRELGFKTFSDWWDESYDEEIGFEKRFERIKQTINSIGKWSIGECEEIYKEMIPILEHNKELAKSFKDPIYDFWEWKDYDIVDYRPKKELLF